MRTSKDSWTSVRAIVAAAIVAIPISLVPNTVAAQSASANSGEEIQAIIPWLTEPLRAALSKYQAQQSEENLGTVLQALPRNTDQFSGDAARFVLEDDILATETDACVWIHNISKKAPPLGSRCEKLEKQRTAVPNPDSAEKRELRVTTSCSSGDAEHPAYCVWPTGDRGKLTYSIEKGTFPDWFKSTETDYYSDLEAAMKQAADAWNGACRTCGLKITRNDNLTIGNDHPFHFVVRFGTPDGDNKCRRGQAFYRKFDASEHILYVYEQLLKYRNGTADETGCAKVLIGVNDWQLAWGHTLRHELGHILGYNHEEIATGGITGNCGLEQDFSVNTLAEYDADSIMHSTGCFTTGSKFTMTGKLSDGSKGDKEKHRQYYKRSH